MAKYIPMVEQPLIDVIQRRKEFYQKKLEKVVNDLYDGGKYGAIDVFEKLVVQLDTQRKAGGLEQALYGLQREEPVVQPEPKKEYKPRPPKGPDKPQLTYALFKKAMKKGDTLEDIRGNFTYQSGKQLGAFAAAYSRYELKGKTVGRKIAKPQKKQYFRRPLLTFEEYAKERDSGVSNEKIKEMYRMSNPYSWRAFAANYTRYHKKK
jgi:hypothetical protein